MKRNASKKEEKCKETEASVTSVTAGRDTNQSFGVCNVNLATPKVAMNSEDCMCTFSQCLPTCHLSSTKSDVFQTEQ